MGDADSSGAGTATAAADEKLSMQLRSFFGLLPQPGATTDKAGAKTGSKSIEPATCRTQRSSSIGTNGSSSSSDCTGPISGSASSGRVSTSEGASGDECGHDGHDFTPIAPTSTGGAKQGLKRLASRLKIAGKKAFSLSFKRGKLPVLGAQQASSGAAVVAGEVEGEGAEEDQRGAHSASTTEEVEGGEEPLPAL